MHQLMVIVFRDILDIVPGHYPSVLSVNPKCPDPKQKRPRDNKVVSLYYFYSSSDVPLYELAFRQYSKRICSANYRPQP